MRDEATIPEGTLILLTHGEYSGYSVVLIARAKREINIEDEWDAWMAAHPGDMNYREWSAWLVSAEGPLVEGEDFGEWNTGDYGDKREMSVRIPTQKEAGDEG